MRNLNGFKWFAVLGFIVGTANADIVIDNNEPIPNADINAISILPGTGTINISTTGYTVTKNTTSSTAVQISSFTASPAAFDKGGSTTVSWAAQNATSCTASDPLGEINGPVASSGSAVLTIVDAGSYQLTLTCQGSSGPVSRALTITVREATVTPTVTCATPTLSGVTNTWSSLWGVEFPGPGYSNENTAVPRSGYLAYKFETGTIVDKGLIVTVGNTRTSGVRTGTISQCPGDFDVGSRCDHVWGIGGGITWSTNGEPGCKLKPNTTYYLNLTFTDGSDRNTSTCSSSQCVATVQHVNQ
jgi:hypothetical protein